ncbi:LLM class flavin-dependent oxidoreductase [Curtobacterium sp. BRB10]|uniref:LLM class flavin-dependent oxidoreductase n=1 Tax=Curtobacterium sp. BRB10 TaxID=2962579 RepID=UPI002881CAB6|nr:LLM class flavin-dependent oxidoreductase [Curtobacterium sp. BRB10]MDT0234809.1 LLM class flavin-dependent oxidoreductase [Curtobacterium sp. BRB10]
MTTPLPFGIAIGERLALDLLTGGPSADPLRAVAGHPSVALVVVGASRPTSTTAVGLDPSVTAAHLVATVPTIGGVLVAVRPGADHPYNTARRVLSVDHLSRGRVGVLFAGVDRRSGGQHGWDPDVDDAALVRDTARLLDELWSAWPLEAFPADQATGHYVDLDGVRHVNHRGAYEVLGPLTGPGSVQGLPVRAQLLDAGEEPLPGLDVVIEHVAGTADGPLVLTWEGRAASGPEARPGSVIELAVPDDVSALADALGPVVDGPHDALPTLRERLGRSAPIVTVDAATPAFATGSTR